MVRDGRRTRHGMPGRTVDRPRGDVVFFNPGVAYSASSISGPCSHVVIHFDFPLGVRYSFLNEFDLMGVIPIVISRRRGHCSSIRSKLPEQRADGGTYVKRLLSRPAGEAIDDPARESFRRLRVPSATKHFAKLKPVLQYIEEHIGDNIPASVLADMIGMSSKYFYAYFKTNIGLTPQSYMTRIRMNRARDMLFERKLPSRKSRTGSGSPTLQRSRKYILPQRDARPGRP